MIVMEREWDGITPEQYDQAHEVVDWDNDVPTGAAFHIASFAAGQPRVTDVWESSQDFQRFVEDRSMPGCTKWASPVSPGW